MSSFNYKYIKIGTIDDLKDISVNTGSFWQSPLWAQILTKTGQAEVFVIENWEKPIFIERRAIWKGFSGLYILWIQDTAITEVLLTSIKTTIVSGKDLFLQIETLDSVQTTWNTGNAPFRRFIEPVTALLDLTLPEETLLTSFAEKGRYNIRLAQKRGITTRWVMSSDKYSSGKTYLEEFFNLLDETTKRDGFSHNSLWYYQHFVETLESHNAGGLLIAEKDGTLHAAGVFAYFWESALYYYGASSSDREIRRDMATYLLQWDAIREAKKRQCTTYDFLGISPNGRGKLAGVTEFKLRFNPEKKHWPREQVIVFRPFMLFLFRCISKLRKLLK